MADTYALIFAKLPVAGAVSTRMVPPLTQDEAAELHRLALATVLETALSHGELRTVLVGTPDDCLAEFQSLAMDPRTDIWPQGGGDLGARLNRSADRAFEEGARRVILLGADSPTMPQRFLDEAVQSLSSRDAVMGPSLDGGYFLLGLGRRVPTLFEGIDWGSDRVADQTRRRAKAAGVRLAELPLWYDLDRATDLPRALHDLNRERATCGVAAKRLLDFLSTLTERYTLERTDQV